MNIKLYQLNKSLKNLLTSFLTLLTMALCVGLVYLMQTNNSSAKGTIERWNGSIESSELTFSGMSENYAKPVSEMLLTTHNHLFGFALIFISIGMVFYFNSTIEGSLKNILLIEPFISAIITFGSIWLMRFVHSNFVYLAIISAVLMYGSYFIMYFVCFYELQIKKDKN